MKKLFKDPLFILSVVLGLIGGAQAGWSYLSPLVEKHPSLFGLIMFGISSMTGAVTAARNIVAPSAPPVVAPSAETP